jgi:hypothetical protein
MNTLLRWTVMSGLAGFIAATVLAVAIPSGSVTMNQFEEATYGFPHPWLTVNRVNRSAAPTPYYTLPAVWRAVSKDWDALRHSLAAMYLLVGSGWLVGCIGVWVVRRPARTPRRQ